MAGADHLHPRPPVVLALDGVSVTVGEATLLHRVGWRVRRGERWVVVGPNGAGKSTLLQVAGTYRFPSRGSVSVLGSRVGRVDVRRLRRRIGYAGAELERMLDGRLTARDAVLSARSALLVRWRAEHSDDDHRRAAALLADLGVDQLADRPITSLSEGERRRVQIARALMPRPDLLLLDEPAAGLDIAGRERLLEMLTRLAADERLGAVVFATHHVEEIPPGFTHALLLADGTVVAGGRLEATLTSAALSRCVGMPIDVTRDDGRYAARALPAPARERRHLADRPPGRSPA